MTNKQIVVISLLGLFYFVGFGFGIGSIYKANFDDLGHWLLLAVAMWFSYNVCAYFFNWTIHGGYSGYIKSNGSTFNRVGGAIISAIMVIVMLAYWFGRLPDVPGA